MIYVRDERKIDKKRVIKAKKIGFALHNKRKKLVVSMLISFIVNGIDRSIVYITLAMNNQVGKNQEIKINIQELYHSFLVIDNRSIIDLKLFISIHE